MPHKNWILESYIVMDGMQAVIFLNQIITYAIHTLHLLTNYTYWLRNHEQIREKWIYSRNLVLLCFQCSNWSAAVLSIISSTRLGAGWGTGSKISSLCREGKKIWWADQRLLKLLLLGLRTGDVIPAADHRLLVPPNDVLLGLLTGRWWVEVKDSLWAK